MSFETKLLAELAAPTKNAIVGGPFGSNLVSKDYAEQGVPVIRGQNMGGRWVGGEFVYVSPSKAEALGANKARPGDLVFTQRGTLGQVALVPRNPFAEYIVSQSQMKVTVDPTKADVEYLYYVFCSQDQLDYIRSTSIQTGVPHTNLGILKKTPVPVPPLSIQKQIAAILGSLDDRITLLRETNATLEAIAQALFKSWFVDFDPVRAKAEGRVPEGMDEATAALFTDGFEESSLGMIPKEWGVGTLANVMRLHKGSVNPGAQPGTDFLHFSLPAFDAGQMPIRELGSAIKSNKTTVPEDAVLVSKLNPHIPRVWLPSTVGKKAVCSTEFLPFVPTGPSTTAFVYSFLIASDFSKALCQLVTGTSNSHQRIKPDGVLSMPCVVPPTEVVSVFDVVVNRLLARLKSSRLQAQTLATLRDTLLPRLISGQLRLPEAQALVEATAQ